MAFPKTNIATQLREAIVDGNKQLQGIQDPDDFFRQEQARISNASKKRIEQFYFHTLQDNGNNSNGEDENVALLLRSLLSDGQQMKRLEMEHEATRAKKQELHNEKATAIGRGIVANLVDILGFSKMQDLVSTSSPPEGRASIMEGYNDRARLAVPGDKGTPEATVGRTTRSRSYNTRQNGGVHEKVAPATSPSARMGDDSLKRKRQPDKHDERGMCQPPKTPRVYARRLSSSPAKAKFYSVRPSTALCTRSGDLLQHSNETDVISSRMAMQSQYKNIRLAVSRPSARVMLQRHPFRRYLWVCMILVPPDQVDMSFDTMVSRSIMPAFLQLANRRRAGNTRQGQAARGHAQAPADTHSSLNDTGEGDGQREKKQFEKKGGQ